MMLKSSGDMPRFDNLPRITPEDKARIDAEAMNQISGKLNDADGYDCTECRNRGYVFFADGIYLTQRDCRCMTARRSIRRMQSSGLGKVIHKYTFPLFITSEEWQKRVKDTALAFIADDDP